MVIYRKYFGRRLSHLIEKTGITQARIVEALGVEPSTVYRWVKGTSLPDDAKAKDLADLFGVSLEDLTGTGPASAGKGARQSPSLGIAEVARLLTALSLASAPRRALILALLFRDESYLDALPRELAPAARALAKVP